MSKTVFIAGAGDLVGRRLIKDLLNKGYKVFAGFLAGQEVQALEGVETLIIDPMSQDSAEQTAEAVKSQAGSVDMVVMNYDNDVRTKGKTILDAPDFEALRQAYEYNTLAPLRILQAFRPLLDAGEGKRICVVTTKASSNNATTEIDNYEEHVSKAPLNMAMNQLFNGLRPDGYTFRMYCKDPEAAAEKAGEFAVEYFTRNRSNEPESYKHSDENRLVLRDWMGIEVPW